LNASPGEIREGRGGRNHDCGSRFWVRDFFKAIEKRMCCFNIGGSVCAGGLGSRETGDSIIA